MDDSIISNKPLYHNTTSTVYTYSKIKELRDKIASLEQETLSLTRELSFKYEECDALNREVVRLRKKIQSLQNIKNEQREKMFFEQELQKKKEEENNEITLSNLEMLVNSYGETIENLKRSFEETEMQHKLEIDKLVQEYEYKIIAIKNENEEKIKEYQILLEEVKKTALDNKYNSNPCCHCHQGEQQMRGEDSFRKKKLSINNNQHSRTINITNRSNYNNNYTMENTSMYKADLTEIDEHIKALKKKIGGL